MKDEIARTWEPRAVFVDERNVQVDPGRVDRTRDDPSALRLRDHVSLVDPLGTAGLRLDLRDLDRQRADARNDAAPAGRSAVTVPAARRQSAGLLQRLYIIGIVKLPQLFVACLGTVPEITVIQPIEHFTDVHYARNTQNTQRVIFSKGRDVH